MAEIFWLAIAAIGVAFGEHLDLHRSTDQVSNNLLLDRFVAGALGELEKLGYRRRSLRRHHACPFFNCGPPLPA
jgi:hypothetical protein